jgi:hypothetical protein
MIRYAIIRNARDRAQAEVYLPENYSVVWEGTARSTVTGSLAPQERPIFVIEGKDVAGWTLDAYVIPRYASGLIQAEEIDLSHPIMKEISC